MQIQCCYIAVRRSMTDPLNSARETHNEFHAKFGCKFHLLCFWDGWAKSINKLQMVKVASRIENKKPTMMYTLGTLTFVHHTYTPRTYGRDSACTFQEHILLYDTQKNKVSSSTSMICSKEKPVKQKTNMPLAIDAYNIICTHRILY